jgi:hypothetical protein
MNSGFNHAVSGMLSQANSWYTPGGTPLKENAPFDPATTVL